MSLVVTGSTRLFQERCWSLVKGTLEHDHPALHGQAHSVTKTPTPGG